MIKNNNYEGPRSSKFEINDKMTPVQDKMTIFL